MCLSQASPDPAGNVFQPGCTGPSWVDAVASVSLGGSHCSSPHRVVIAFSLCCALWLRCHSGAHCGSLTVALTVVALLSGVTVAAVHGGFTWLLLTVTLLWRLFEMVAVWLPSHCVLTAPVLSQLTVCRGVVDKLDCQGGFSVALA